MDEIEMIQSAAKAVGFLFDPNLTGEDGTLVGRYRDEANGPTYVWNPVKDLNDAVTMACILKIQLDPKDDRVWAHYGNAHMSEDRNQGLIEATCLVFTRMAAEIGKSYL